MTGRWLPGRAADIDFASIRAELGIRTKFPDDVIACAERAAARPITGGRDATGIPLVTIDPPGSLDLDQAVHLEARDGGYRVHYAIADVARFVEPGDPIDVESHRRGQTFYCPDTRIPLHPLVLSEGAASLLPDRVVPAVLWTMLLDETGAVTSAHVERAVVRSAAQLDYPGVQADADRATLHPSIALLPEIGALREAAARARHAIELDLPDAEIVRDDAGRWTLSLRAVLPVERWNAEISLMTGMCAGEMMLQGRVGLLRTLPLPGKAEVAELRKSTAAFGIPWPRDLAPGDVIATLDASRPPDAAFLEDAVRLLRGAGYTAFDGQLPERTGHAGVGAVYAHVTAPLRRLADRYATEICLALQSGNPVPEWVSAGLDDVVTAMADSDRTAGALDRACTGAVATFLLAGREGEEFEAVVVQIDAARDRATVVLDQFPIRAKCSADRLVEGTRIRVRLESADPATHHFTVTPTHLAGAAAPT